MIGPHWSSSVGNVHGPLASRIASGLIFLCVFWFSAARVQAQTDTKVVNFHAEPDTFLIKYAEYIGYSKFAPADAELAGFSTLWTSNTLTSDQKRRCMTVAERLRFINASPVPHYLDWMKALNSAATLRQITGQRLDNLLLMQHKTLINLGLQQFTDLNRNVDMVLVNQAVFATSKYALKHSPEAQVDFDYPGVPDPSDTTKPKVDSLGNPIFDASGPPPNPYAYLTEPDTSIKGIDGSPVPEETPPPLIEGPIITFTKTDLTFGVTDSLSLPSTLKGTEGILLPLKLRFIGKGGKFSWDVAGIGGDSCFAELGKYQLETNIPALTSERSVLNYSRRFDKPIAGRFNYRNVPLRNGPSTNPFPKFESLSGRMEIQGLPDNIKVIGGISMDGKVLSTNNVYGDLTELFLRNEDKIIYKGQGSKVTIDDSLLFGPDIYSTIYFGSDSIYHSGAYLTLPLSRNEVRLETTKGRYATVPYVDTYHKLEITTDYVRFLPDSSLIVFNILTGKDRVPASFESTDYYNDIRESYFKSLDRFDPITALYKKVKDNGTNQVFLGEIVDTDKGLSRELVSSKMQELASFGFIDYDLRTDRIAVRPKLIHYFDSRKEKKDFDFMSVKSVAAKTDNARLNTQTKELKIYGVQRFYLSDSLNVFIQPKNGELQVLEDRNLKFDGAIQAGQMKTSGKDFTFDYKKFAVDLNAIDSVNMQFKGVKPEPKSAKDVKGKKKKFEGTPYLKLEGQRHGLSDSTRAAGTGPTTKGKLFINDSENKSGNRSTKQYPKYDISDNTFIYFDNKSILDGVYNTNIYFKLPPFKLDSAQSGKKGLAFNGTFHSDNIFPEFEERMEVQNGKAASFLHKVPKEGYQLYGGTAKFYGLVSMSLKGIRGKGRIKYGNTTLESNDFVFYQDSIVAKGKVFKIKEGVTEKGSFPDATISAYNVKFLPKSDSMIVNSTEKEPFKLFKGSTELDGTLIVTNTGLKGSGKVTRAGSSMESKDLGLTKDEMTGKNALFTVSSDDPEKPNMRSNGVSFKYNVKDSSVSLNTEIENSGSHVFPYVKYKTSIGQAIWNIGNRTITMSKPDSIDLSYSYFTSMGEGQDSLRFNGSSAVYHIANSEMIVRGVPHINCGDSKIIPDSNKVVLRENATMGQLENAVMMVDTINTYHVLNKSTVQIAGKYDYKGEGVYRFINAAGDSVGIFFADVRSKLPKGKPKKGKEAYVVSEGEAEVLAEQPIKVAPGIIYKGKITFSALKPGLVWAGFLATDAGGEGSEKGWVPFKAQGEKVDFVIDLSKAKSSDTKNISSGIFYESGSQNLYVSFMAAKTGSSDMDLFSATGAMNFDSEKKEHMLGSKKRLSGEELASNLFRYREADAFATAEGKINFFDPKDNQIAVNASGTVMGSGGNKQFDATVSVQLDMAIPEPILKSMADQLTIYGQNTSAPAASSDKLALMSRLASLAGQSAAQGWDQANSSSYVSIPSKISKLGKGLFFSELELKWNAEQTAWVSNGQLGISNFGKTDINAKLNGLLEIRKGSAGDVITLFIEGGEKTWYYLNYDETKKLSILSSRGDFNADLQAKVQGKPPVNGQFSLAMAEHPAVATFVVNFNKTYYGKDVLEPAAPEELPVGGTLGEPSQEKPADAPTTTEEGAPKSDKPAGTEKEKPAATDTGFGGEAPKTDSTQTGGGLDFGAAPVETKQAAAPKKKETPKPKKEAPKPVPVEDTGFGGVAPVEEKPKTDSTAPAAAPVVPPPTEEKPKVDSAAPALAPTPTPAPPAEEKPKEEKPADPAPTPAPPAEEKPKEEKPADPAPTPAPPAEEKPKEEKPADPAPTPAPPAEEKPKEEKPAEPAPTPAPPAEEKPKEEKPAEPVPTPAPPVEEKPKVDSTAKPVVKPILDSTGKPLPDSLQPKVDSTGNPIPTPAPKKEGENMPVEPIENNQQEQGRPFAPIAPLRKEEGLD